MQLPATESGKTPELASMTDLTAADVVIWSICFVIASATVWWLYHLLINRLAKWMYSTNRAIALPYIIHASLGLVVAFLIDRIGFRELFSGIASNLDRVLMPAFCILLPSFISISVAIPVSALGHEKLVKERLEAKDKEIADEKVRAEQAIKFGKYFRGMREDAARVAECLTHIVRERIRRVKETGTHEGTSSCKRIHSTLDTGAHHERIVQGIHLVFESRAHAIQTKQFRIDVLDSNPPPGSNTGSDSVGVAPSWRVALFEQRSDELHLVHIWDGRLSTCCFTPKEDLPYQFSTSKPQAGTFAVNCLLNSDPIILADTQRSHKDPASPFKFFPKSPSQTARVRSIAGFVLKTTPSRVVVIDANLPRFFDPDGDSALFRQIQGVVQTLFEYEDAWQSTISCAVKDCQKVH